MRLEVAAVAVRSASKERSVELPPGVLTTDAAAVVDDPSIDVVVEVIGGIEPARALIAAALAAKKPVVTGNKELLANVGAELFAAAHDAGVDLLFEAAVAGGIPLIRPLRESLVGERITRVMGIVNGTTNFILTRMTEDGVSYHEALAEAQSLGYAERDPTADVEGYDAGAKAAIIASIAFGARVVAGDVYHEGISGITAADIAFAKRLGYVVKLLAIVESVDGAIGVRVHPAMVPVSHPLASVRESYNAVFVEGEAVGNLMFYGRGAGGHPTASAVLGDLIDAATQPAQGLERVGRHAGRGAHPPDRRGPVRVLPRTSRSPTGPACSPRSPACSAATTCRSGRWSRKGSATRPGSSSSRTPRVRPTCRRRCTTCAISTSSTVSARCCGSSRDPIRQHTRSPLPSSASTTRCSRVWRATAASTSRRRCRSCQASCRQSYAGAADGHHRRRRVDSSPRRTPPSTTPRSARWCSSTTTSGCRSCGTVRRWRSRTSPSQLVGRLMDDELERRGERRTIVVATSGDTGSAAIAACVGRSNLDIVVLHPAGRVSDVQRRQMTTVDEPNVHNVAVEGTFDDCQDLVKAMFADVAFRDELHLGAMNSINWGRVVAQIVYYVTGQITVGRPCTFCGADRQLRQRARRLVRRGGWATRSSGSSSARTATTSSPGGSTTGALVTESVVPTISPTMDIQVSSNLERLLFELLDRDGARTAELMVRFRELGSVEAPRDPRVRGRPPRRRRDPRRDP